MDKWPRLIVSKIAGKKRNAIVGGPFGSDLVSKDYTSFGIPVIRGVNLGCGRWVAGDFVYVSEEKADSLSANCAEPGDLVFTQRGTIGQVALVPQNEHSKYLISQSQMKLSVDSDKADSLFLYYTFIGKQQQKYIQQNAIRTGVPHTNLGILRDTPIFLPSLPTQKKISAFVDAIDSKIELNNKINAELEAMAKLIYDYWFVQFDFPDANGKAYKSSGGKMIYNETLKREIPEGWASGRCSDLFEFNPKLSIKKGAVSNHIDMNAIPTAGFMTKKPKKKEFSGGMKFQNGDIVIARITPCLENGKTGLISLLDEHEIGFGSTEFVILRGKEFDLRCFGASMARSEKFRKYAISKMTGTSGRKRVNHTALENYELAIPSDSLLRKFEEKLSPLFEKMTANTKENQELAELRDWLLPMLMNGQVTIKSPQSNKP